MPAKKNFVTEKLPVKIYSRYDPPPSEGMTFKESTRTQQHFKNECDINMIISRAIQTNNVALLTPTERGEYFDSSSFESYQDSLDYLAHVEDDFMSLPSSVRKEFGQDVGRYVAFMSDANNISKAVELGLLEGIPKDPVTSGASGISNPPVGPSETVFESAATE